MRKGHDSLQITVRGIDLGTADANGTPTRSGVSDLSVRLPPIQDHRAVPRARVCGFPRALPERPVDDHAVLQRRWRVYVEGYQHHWFVGAATSSDSRTPFWTDAEFDRHRRRQQGHKRIALPAGLTRPITLNVPLGSVCLGQLFTVHVSMDAEAIDDRGGESGAWRSSRTRRTRAGV